MLKSKLIVYSFLMMILVGSCFKDRFRISEDTYLRFSVDTLSFDTVFTHLGTATRFFKVYNPYQQSVKIDRIFLARGESSPFRLNINGVPKLSVKDLVIPPRDSIYIFIDVTIDPLKNYLTEIDSVVFAVGGHLQSVKLLAVGWRVHLLKRYVVSEDEFWNSQMPYLIFDYLIVDTNVTLRITEGTKIFLHRGAVFYVAGSLKVKGSRDSMVVFAADRLEEDYRHLPGQWGGIVLSSVSSGSEFQFVEIRNSVIGISVDSVQDTVKIYNSVIWHQSYANIFGCCTNVKILGSLLADAGWYNIAFVKGGDYLLVNNTIANYYSWGTIRQTPAVAVTNYAIIGGRAVFWQPVTFRMYNTIVYGSLEDELVLSAAKQWQNFTYSLSSCIIKTKDLYDCTDCKFNTDPLFNKIESFDFHLTENSPAVNAANTQIVKQYLQILEYDLDGKWRLEDGLPDIGCFEFNVNSE